MHARPQGQAQSRIEQIKSPDMPEIKDGKYLLDLLFSIGPAIAGYPLTFAELQAWQQSNSIKLDGFESNTIRRLSVAYLSEYNAASDPARPAPYRRIIDRDAVDSGFRALAARMKGK
jgi:hypothetical protein